MLKIALSSFIICLLFCAQTMAQASKVDSSEMRTLRIDPSSARGAAASQLFEEIKFIPLETTKESLFCSISQLRMTDDSYVIFDYDTKAILIFTREGKYKAKIGASKIEKDPENKDNQDFYGFEIKTEDNQSIIRLQSGKYYFNFDLDGKRISKVLIDKKKVYDSPYKFSDGTVADRGYLDKKEKDSTYYEISLVKDKKKIESYFPYSVDRYKNDQFYTGGESLINYGVPDEFFFLTAYEYNIYRLTSKKLSLAYRMIFPANNSLPADFRSNPVYKGKRQSYFQANPKAIFAIGNPYQLGDNLYFKTNSWTWGQDERKAFIYNLKNNMLTSISDIEPDSLSQFLPVTDAGVHYDFANNGFLHFDGTFFYTSYSSLLMFKFKEQNEGKSRVYDLLLSAYFRTQDKKSNPVIIQLKPKKN